MSYSLPTTASAVTVTAWLQALDDSVEIAEGLFYGPTAPAHKNGRRWIDTTTSPVLPMKVSLAAAWVTIFDNVAVAGGGLARVAAAAFTTTAPTSAIAASSASHLVRKNEADSRIRSHYVLLGTVDATATFELGETPQIASIVDVRLLTPTAQAISATDYRSFQVYDETAAASLQGGTVGPPPTGVILAASTFSPGGAAFVANTWRACGVNQNNAALAINHRLTLRVTRTGTPAALTSVLAQVRMMVAV